MILLPELCIWKKDILCAISVLTYCHGTHRHPKIASWGLPMVNRASSSISQPPRYCWSIASRELNGWYQSKPAPCERRTCTAFHVNYFPSALEMWEGHLCDKVELALRACQYLHLICYPICMCQYAYRTISSPSGIYATIYFGSGGQRRFCALLDGCFY